jgi:hypothetical protein
MFNLTYRQVELLCKGLAHAFPEISKLEVFLFTALGRSLSHYAAQADTLQVACFRLIRSAEAEGWSRDLVTKLSAEVPHNLEIIQLVSQLGALASLTPPPKVSSDHREHPSQPKCYVSYAWGDDSPEGRERDDVVDQLCAEAKTRGIRIIRDKTAMTYGDRISEFMAQLGRGDRVFIILSDKYLKSLYCMSELFDVWRNCKENEAEFAKRTRVFTLASAKLQTPKQRAKYALYWRKAFEKCDAFMKRQGPLAVADKDVVDLRLMARFVSETANILALVQDVLGPHDFTQFVKYGFDDPL